MISAHWEGLDELIDSLRSALDSEAYSAMGEVQVRVVRDARANHRFKNRTRILEGSIVPDRVSGSLSRGSLSGIVLATADYASYLEDHSVTEGGGMTRSKWAFLMPAFVRLQPELEDLIATRLDSAAEAALR